MHLLDGVEILRDDQSHWLISTQAVAAKVADGVPNLSHRCQDFLADDACWSSDVLFCNSTAFSAELIADVERKCASLKRGAVIITLTTRLDAPELELIQRFDAPASWGVATVFVHRRV